jgi:hypothetical protein
MADTPTGIMMDATYKGKDVTIYSTTGQKKTESDFAGAMAEYDKTGKIPKGYTVLEPGTASNWLRSTFERVNQPLQNAAERVDAGLPLLGGPQQQGGAVQQLLARRTMGNPEGAVQGNTDNAGLTRAITGTVDTPGKAGMTAGMALAAPALAPVSIATGAGKMAMSGMGILQNVGVNALAAGTGSVLMDAALGGTEPFDISKAVVPVLMGAAAGGVQGVIGHLINKYIKPELHEEVAKNILKPIADRYPNYKTDPTLFDAAASSPEKVKDITVAMAKGMRGSLDSTTHDLTQQILQVSPVRLTVGEQATLRAHVRNVSKVANDILDKVSTDKPLDQALPDLQEPLVNMGKYLYTTLKQKGVKQFTKVDADMAGVLGQFKQSLTNFEEGAQVLNAFRQSGQQNGFDVATMRDILVGKTTSGQTDVMGQVAKELGMGRPLTETEQPANKIADSMLNLAKRHVPIIGRFMKPSQDSYPPMMPWQLQQPGAARTVGIGVQAAGQDAIDSFMNRKSDITINIEKKSK